jgi:ADP-ribosyl-[dinitrogen reductase] hydrolase
MDLERIKAFGAKALVTLMPDHELRSLEVSAELLRAGVEHLGMQWYQLPIPDFSIPDKRFEQMWSHVGRRLRGLLKNSITWSFHCKGGLGRTGTIVARLLVEFGVEPGAAIKGFTRLGPGDNSHLSGSRQDCHSGDTGWRPGR